MGMIQGDWASLPNNILGIIMDKLVPHNHCLIGGVCSNWYSAYVEERSLKGKKHSSRLHALLGPGESGEGRFLLNVGNGEILNNVVGVHRDRCSRGSCYGWLILLDCVGGVFYVELREALSNESITLPALNNIVILDNDERKPQLYIRKAVLSLNPLFAPEKYVVLAIVSRKSRLIYWKPGFEEWRTIEWGRTMFEDVVYSSKSEQFFTVNQSGEIYSINMGGDVAQLVNVCPSPDGGWVSKRYLVEYCEEEMLQVLKLVSGSGSKESFVMKTKFKVFKFDLKKGEWSAVSSLRGTLFLGMNNSLHVSNEDYRKSCIYFSDDFDYHCTHKRQYSPEEMGIYSLEDGTVDSLFPYAVELHPPPIWIEEA